MASKTLLTVWEVAANLKVSTVRRMLARGDIPAGKVGARQWRVSEAALKAYIEGGEKPTKGMMALHQWPSTVEVEFTEVMDQISAVIYERFSGKVLAAYRDSTPEGLMRWVRESHTSHGSAAVFHRPWPTIMEGFFRHEIAEARRTMAESRTLPGDRAVKEA